MTKTTPSLRFSAPSLISIALAFFACAGGIASATTIDWSSTASTTAWATAANWSGGPAPANDLTTDIARFNQTSYVSQPNAGTRSIAGIVIGDGTTTTAALTISGTALSIGGSGIITNTSAGTATISASSIALGTNQTWTMASGTTLIASTAISGNFSLTKAGTGTLTLSGAETYTGGFILTDGTVKVGNNASFGTGTLTLNSGVVTSSGAARTVANNITLGGNIQLGQIGLNGLITYTGVKTISTASQLTFANNANAGAAFSTGNIVLNAGLTLDNEITTTGITITSAIVDGASSNGLTLASTGTGAIILSGANTYSGGTAINAGTLKAGSTSALSTGIVTFGGGTLDLNNFDLVTNALAGSSGTITNTAVASTHVLTIGQGDGSGSFGGVISQSQSGKIVGITKTGSGTQKFSGANTYLGQTLVNAGTLLINGTNIDATVTGTAVNGYGSTTTGHFQVTSGATLGGSGRIQGNNGSLTNTNLVLIQSGGHLAPGDGIGALTFDGANLGGAGSRVLNMASGAVFDFQLVGNGGTPDQINFWSYVSGDLLLNNTTLNLTLSGTQSAGTYTVDLFQFYSDAGTSVAATAIASGLTLGSLGAGISSATINYNTNTIGLTYTIAAIPEPSTCALLGGLSVLLIAMRRRKAA